MEVRAVQVLVMTTMCYLKYASEHHLRMSNGASDVCLSLLLAGFPEVTDVPVPLGKRMLNKGGPWPDPAKLVLGSSSGTSILAATLSWSKSHTSKSHFTQ